MKGREKSQAGASAGRPRRFAAERPKLACLAVARAPSSPPSPSGFGAAARINADNPWFIEVRLGPKSRHQVRMMRVHFECEAGVRLEVLQCDAQPPLAGIEDVSLKRVRQAPVG